MKDQAPCGHARPSVVEDRCQLLTVEAGPVDGQLGDDLVDCGYYRACLLHPVQLISLPYFVHEAEASADT
jgi:hypothetical protein